MFCPCILLGLCQASQLHTWHTNRHQRYKSGTSVMERKGHMAVALVVVPLHASSLRASSHSYGHRRSSPIMAVITRSHSAKSAPISSACTGLTQPSSPRSSRKRSTRKPAQPQAVKATTRKQISPHISAARSKRSKPSSPQIPTKARAKQAKSQKPKSSRLTRSKPKLPSEYELGPDGLAIVDQLTGFPKLSKFGQRVLEEVR